jgi:hypothetical protein
MRSRLCFQSNSFQQLAAGYSYEPGGVDEDREETFMSDVERLRCREFPCLQQRVPTRSAKSTEFQVPSSQLNSEFAVPSSSSSSKFEFQVPSSDVFKFFHNKR